MKKRKDLWKLTDLPNGNSVVQVKKGENLVKPQVSNVENDVSIHDIDSICSFTDFQERQRIEIAKKIANKNLNEILADCQQFHNNGFKKKFSDNGTDKKSLHLGLEDPSTRPKKAGGLEGSSNFQATSAPYHPIENALSDIAVPLFGDDSHRYIKIREAFLINEAGLVVSYASQVGANVLNEDIVGGMLAAVESFVKDAFNDGESSPRGLETLVYGNTRILIEHGKLVFLVAVFSGAEPEGMREDLRKIVKKIENKYFDVLTKWDGNLDKVKEIVKIIQSLISIRYRIRRDLGDIDLMRGKDVHKAPKGYIEVLTKEHEDFIPPPWDINQSGKYGDILQPNETTSSLKRPKTLIIAS